MKTAAERLRELLAKPGIIVMPASGEIVDSVTISGTV